MIVGEKAWTATVPTSYRLRPGRRCRRRAWTGCSIGSRVPNAGFYESGDRAMSAKAERREALNVENQRGAAATFPGGKICALAGHGAVGKPQNLHDLAVIFLHESLELSRLPFGPPSSQPPEGLSPAEPPPFPARLPSRQEGNPLSARKEQPACLQGDNHVR